MHDGSVRTEVYKMNVMVYIVEVFLISSVQNLKDTELQNIGVNLRCIYA